MSQSDLCRSKAVIRRSCRWAPSSRSKLYVRVREREREEREKERETERETEREREAGREGGREGCIRNNVHTAGSWARYAYVCQYVNLSMFLYRYPNCHHQPVCSFINVYISVCQCVYVCLHLRLQYKWTDWPGLSIPSHLSLSLSLPPSLPLWRCTLHRERSRRRSSEQEWSCSVPSNSSLIVFLKSQRLSS